MRRPLAILLSALCAASCMDFGATEPEPIYDDSLGLFMTREGNFM